MVSWSLRQANGEFKLMCACLLFVLWSEVVSLGKENRARLKRNSFETNSGILSICNGRSLDFDRNAHLLFPAATPRRSFCSATSALSRYCARGWSRSRKSAVLRSQEMNRCRRKALRSSGCLLRLLSRRLTWRSCRCISSLGVLLWCVSASLGLTTVR